MRKLKLQMQLSIDGFVAGANGEMDWMVWNWDDALKNYVKELTLGIDCIVMGRKLAEGFIPHWENIAKNPEDDQFEFATIMHDTHKVVFTTTLQNFDWKNTEISGGDLVEEINKLKQTSGKDIIVYGGSTFVSNLIKNNLIDEYHLFINPTVLGSGMPIFRDVQDKLKLELVKSTDFGCGIVVMCYRAI
ncbi:MAG: dihydrofolate reductase family protein [Bacteroidetes bacterium]|nr:dihydrofolate reductase family protein [Bacteroidota bacterium]